MQEWLSEASDAPKSPIISPDSDSKPAISRTRFSTFIPRGIRGGQKGPDKPKIRPLSTNKPRIMPRQKQVPKKKTQIVHKVPRGMSGFPQDSGQDTYGARKPSPRGS